MLTHENVTSSSQLGMISDTDVGMERGVNFCTLFFAHHLAREMEFVVGSPAN